MTTLHVSNPLLFSAAEREVLALGNDREKVYDMHIFTVDERVCEDGRDVMVRCATSRAAGFKGLVHIIKHLASYSVKLSDSHTGDQQAISSYSIMPECTRAMTLSHRLIVQLWAELPYLHSSTHQIHASYIYQCADSSSRSSRHLVAIERSFDGVVGLIIGVASEISLQS